MKKSYNQFLDESILSFIRGPKKKEERPQTATGTKGDAYRQHNDMHPSEVPVFKPSFQVKSPTKTEAFKPGLSNKSTIGKININKPNGGSNNNNILKSLRKGMNAQRTTGR